MNRETEFPVTLVEALQRAAGTEKGVTFIAGQEQEQFLGYRQLLQNARRVLGHLRKQGLQQADELIIFQDNNAIILDAFWACLCGGIVAVPLAVGSNDSHRLKLLNVFRQLERGYLYTSRKQFLRLAKFAEQHGLSAELSELEQRTLFAEDVSAQTLLAEVSPVSAEQTAFIQFSSGSTGSPKGVVLSHRNLIANTRSIILSAEVRADDRFLSWMPLTHDMGIIGFHLTPLLFALEHYLIPTEVFIRRPSLWLNKAGEKKASVLSSPNFGYRYLLKRFKPDANLDLSHVRIIFNGAEPISAEVCREFLDAMQEFGLPEAAMFTVYGLAEASVAMTIPQPGTGLTTVWVQRHSLEQGSTVEFSEPGQGTELVLLGGAIIDTEIRIVNQRGEVLPDDTLGQLQIKGPNVMSGYYALAQLNRETVTDDGWVNTGDLGFLHHGQLVISGRSKDLITSNGANFFPADLEALCDQVAGIELGKIVVNGIADSTTGGDRIVAFAVHRGDLERFVPLVQQVKSVLAEHSGLEVDEVLPVRQIPKTTSGKVQRFSLRQAYENGDFQQIQEQLAVLLSSADVESVENAADAIEAGLLKICREVLNGQVIAAQDNLFDAGTSSLALAEIHAEIDEQWPDMVEMTDYFDYPTIRELAGYIRQQVADKADSRP